MNINLGRISKLSRLTSPKLLKKINKKDIIGILKEKPNHLQKKLFRSQTKDKNIQ